MRTQVQSNNKLKTAEKNRSLNNEGTGKKSDKPKQKTKKKTSEGLELQAFCQKLLD